jgi:hypothetical protein
MKITDRKELHDRITKFDDIATDLHNAHCVKTLLLAHSNDAAILIRLNVQNSSSPPIFMSMTRGELAALMLPTINKRIEEANLKLEIL